MAGISYTGMNTQRNLVHNVYLQLMPSTTLPWQLPQEGRPAEGNSIPMAANHSKQLR